MLLVIETAFALSVALLDDDRIVAEEHREVGRGHAEALMPAVAAVVGNSRVTEIVVDIGPGSFTGLRIGIAAARALGLAWGVPVTGVGSLSLIAAAAFAADPSLAAVTAVADAGRGQVYWQSSDRDFAETGEAAAGALGTIALPPSTTCAGPGAALIPGAQCLDPAPPRAASLRHLPRSAWSLPPVPLYLRAPDAVAA
ncbi:tRNA (adenosine(37)-N6)-threonylcarbamoyltransferase complex dimerization subunit type 1 TsaB [Glacieibacterium megasporae]|uniref:tRNA (adenosine(37)-N6)-threonylcarbamoyltransferase complex dimerization subunit type 1 TsaB n=1 Tax=Glacieibacterium megasporae TaxID=2835787 RepID=UPI0034E20494